MKNYILCVLFIMTSLAYAEECFEFSKAENIPPAPIAMGSYGGTTMNTDKSAYIVAGSSGFGLEQADHFSIYNIKTKEKTKYSKGLHDTVFWMQDKIVISHNRIEDYENFPSGPNFNLKKYLEQLQKKVFTILDPKTGVSKDIVGKFYDYQTSEMMTPTSVEEKNGMQILVTKNNSGKTVKNPLNKRPDSLSQMISSHDITLGKDGKLKVYRGVDLLYEGDSKIPPLAEDNSSRFQMGLVAATTNERFIYVPVSSAVALTPNSGSSMALKFLVYDTKNKNQKSIEVPAGYYPTSLDKKNAPKQENLILLEPTMTAGPPIILDLVTGKTKTIGNKKLNQIFTDEKNNLCGIEQNSPSMYGMGMARGFDLYGNPISSESKDSKAAPPISLICYSLEGKLVSSDFITKDNQSIVVMLDKKNYFLTQASDYTTPENSQLVTPQKVCPKKIEFNECDCNGQISPKIDLNSILTIQLKIACQNDFNPSEWSQITPYPVTKLDDNSAPPWLKKFSKPNGFNPTQDLSILESLIKGKVYQKNAEDFQAAMSGVLDYSATLYEEILLKYPEISQLSSTDSNNCLTEREKNKIKESKKIFFKNKLARLKKPTSENIRPIIELGKAILNEEQKDKLAEDIADIVVVAAGKDPILKEVFPSKIYKFSYNHNKDLLGIDHKKITDLTITRAKGQVNFIQLAVGPFEGSKETLGGFYLKIADKKKDSTFVGQNQIKEVKWDYNGKTYLAKVDIQHEPSQVDITPANLAPNYKEMKKDKPFKGLIVAGQNLGKPTTDMVVRNYIEYYANEGFDFDEAQEIKDLPGLLEDRISGKDPAHYFVKEAHSDGDEKNLFRINTSGKLLTGTKIVDGKKEIIEIVYPGKDDTSVLLSNNDFGKWMKKREADVNGSELIYFNSSCWSASKATYEITAAKTPKLINIPTTTSMLTFANREQNVMYSAIDGIRKEKTYAEIRTDMEKNESYKKRTDNVMIFPDEEAYNVHIRNALKIPLHIDTTISVQTDKGAVPYSIEEGS